MTSALIGFRLGWGQATWFQGHLRVAFRATSSSDLNVCPKEQVPTGPIHGRAIAIYHPILTQKSFDEASQLSPNGIWLARGFRVQLLRGHGGPRHEDTNHQDKKNHG